MYFIDTHSHIYYDKFNHDLNIINNFGWPISNYGYHYGEQNAINE